MDLVEHWLAPARQTHLKAKGVNAAVVIAQLAFYTACRFFRTIMNVVTFAVHLRELHAGLAAQLKKDWCEILNVDVPRGFRGAAAAIQVSNLMNGVRSQPGIPTTPHHLRGCSRLNSLGICPSKRRMTCG
jgi:hypothetical protein